jgi:hypothetical protein
MMERGGGRRRPALENPQERSGLGAIDVIAIVVVIMLLGGGLGALVVTRAMGLERGTAWVERTAESLLGWVASEAQQTTPTSPTAR